MEDNTLYAIIWGCAATVLLTIILCITFYTYNIESKIVSSPNPIDAACAISNSHSAQACIIANRR